MLNFPNHFLLPAIPQTFFGAGSIQKLPAAILAYGKRVLIITGKRSFTTSQQWSSLSHAMEASFITWEIAHISGEPSPTQVDAIVQQFHDAHIDVVVGIGGGSALDAAKAIAGLLPHGNSVMDHLEGVGNNIPYSGISTPLIAIPTTAGTGSEASKNSVLSQRGEHGFKKSFRHDALVAKLAIIDPELLYSCPRSRIASNGMDAFVQLLESYLSKSATPFSDALAWSGLQAFAASFSPLMERFDHPCEENTSHYQAMTYASFISGITLAQVGLGSIHALASPIGAYSNMPHGEVCGTLLAVATQVNIEHLRQHSSDQALQSLYKYAQVGRLLLGQDHTTSDTQALETLSLRLEQMVEDLAMPKLSNYGICAADLQRIATHTGSLQNNPILLQTDQLIEILARRL
ncbi:MAG: iron-containing alcohol dehydrogenase [Zetaproteobacteria bacterium]|nr:iron-containing alcohol dehydrogenase [Zetaproteobacteria bacterium]